MARRSQSSSIGENPLDPNYLPPHYREEYRLAIDALIENDIKVAVHLTLTYNKMLSLVSECNQLDLSPIAPGLL